MLNQDEKLFYSRQLLLPEVGALGQQKLKQAKVLVIGAGGLGCPLLTYLTAAGVGNIGIVDADIIDKTNLHRQVLFGYSQVGMPKVDAAINRLKDLNPHVNFKGYFEKLLPENAIEIIQNYDIVVDATDNFPTRYLINDACVILDKPFVLGSIDRFQGQVSVMNFKDKNGNTGATYRCLFPSPPKPETAPNCVQIGVLGVLPGIVGSIQANEVIKMIIGFGDVLSGKLFVLDTANSTSFTMKIKRNEKMVQLAKSLKDNLRSFDYIDFCHLKNTEINEIEPALLKRKLANKEEVQIIDVRESGSVGPISGTIKIPLSKIKTKIKLIDRERSVILYCDYGITSISAAYILAGADFKNVFSLKGGLVAWNSEFEKVRKINV